MGDVGDVEVERAAVDLLRRRVLNVVGHELRTPVTTLRGLAESLGSAGDPAAEADLREALRRTARRTEALLDDLLLATGVSTALPVGDPVPCPVAATARAAWAELDSAAATGAELEVAGDAVVAAPPGVLHRVLNALLDNAARYGEAPVQLRVRTVGPEVEIVVLDRGPGLPAAEVALATEPFFRGERAVLGHHSLGLGLSVVRSLAEHLDGSVEVRNRDGGGFAVELRLPAAEAA